MTKVERLREMERLYVDRAYSDSELADRLGVERSTIYRHRLELQTEYPLVEVTPGRYKIDRARYLSGIRLNLHEALALYLAARRASRLVRSAQPHLASALEKLATALRQPMTARLTRASGEVLLQPAQPEQLQVLETVTRAWAEGVRLVIHYHSFSANELHEHRVDPYLIEPSPNNESAYLIGYSDRHQDVATFKLERIQQAWLTTQPAEIPADFDESELLKIAWGIWWGEGAPVTVRLRFYPGPAARRVRESVWHPSQQIVALPDGGCEWQAQVGEWREMFPWVRGWGADVEVLAPAAMRQAMEEEVMRLRERYG